MARPGPARPGAARPGARTRRAGAAGSRVRVAPATGRRRLRWGAARYGAGVAEADAFWDRADGAAGRRAGGAGARQRCRPWCCWALGPSGSGGKAGPSCAAWRRGGGDHRPLPRLFIALYHAYEYLWAVGNAVFGVEPPKTRRPGPSRSRRGCTRGPAPVQAAVAARAHTLGARRRRTADAAGGRRTAPAEAAAEESAAATAVRRAYLAATAARLDYPACGARHLPIGSGAVESAGKSVSQPRTKGAGRRGRGAGAPAVVSLRPLHRAGRWDVFGHAQPQRARRRLVPRPRPARTPPSSVAAGPVPDPAPPPRDARPSRPRPADACPRPAPARHGTNAPCCCRVRSPPNDHHVLAHPNTRVRRRIERVR